MDCQRSRITLFTSSFTTWLWLNVLLLFAMPGQCKHRQRAYSLIDRYCPENCFCPRLEEVWCRDVPLTGISEYMWPKLENLTIIKADLGRLTSNMFSRYPHLKRLHLRSVNVRAVEPNAFAGLPRLHSLQLLGNNIDRLDDRDLAHLANVKEIYLTDNNIKRIGRNAFYGSYNIGTLDLRNNPAVQLESGAFNGLRHVEHLLLPADMVLIEPGAFENLSNIHYLEIRQWKAKESAWSGVAPGTFRGLKEVKTIQIEKSDLGVIRPQAFAGLTGVEYLYIRNSMINRVRKSSFAGMNRVRKLGLTKNYIDHIDYMALFVDQSASESADHHGDQQGKGIRQLDINKNRLNCTCPKNAWIIYDEQVARNYASVLRNNTCSYPAALQGADLITASVQVRQWPCEYGHDTDAGSAGARISWIMAVVNVIAVTLSGYYLF